MVEMHEIPICPNIPIADYQEAIIELGKTEEIGEWRAR